MKKDCKVSCTPHLKAANGIKIHLQHCKKSIIQQGIHSAIQCFPNSFCQWTSNFLLREVNIKAPWAWDRKTTHSRALYNTELKRKPAKAHKPKGVQGKGLLPCDSTRKTPLCGPLSIDALNASGSKDSRRPRGLSLYSPHSSISFLFSLFFY